MENASKALIMAATVLIGVMIISIGVALFNSFSDFSRLTVEKMDEKKLAEWNNNFYKYYGNDGNGETIKVTAHDIVSVINLAKQNNDYYQLGTENRGKENTYYVQVKVNRKNYEDCTEEDKEKFLKENSLTDDDKEINYYKCLEPKISEITKRVMSIEFVDYK